MLIDKIKRNFEFMVRGFDVDNPTIFFGVETWMASIIAISGSLSVLMGLFLLSVVGLDLVGFTESRVEVSSFIPFVFTSLIGFYVYGRLSRRMDSECSTEELNWASKVAKICGIDSPRGKTTKRELVEYVKQAYKHDKEQNEKVDWLTNI
jgi:hypothetical protein